jgi:hypothetical protein
MTDGLTTITDVTTFAIMSKIGKYYVERQFALDILLDTI